jgi:hypothetical protein
MFVKIPTLFFRAVAAVKRLAKNIEPVEHLFFGVPERAFAQVTDYIAKDRGHQNITAS